MLILLLIGLQSSTGPPAPKPERLRIPRSCKANEVESADVIVCGRIDQDQFRLKPLPERYEESAFPRAEAALGDGKVATEVEQSGVGGFPSNRIMLRFKLPF